MKQCALTRCRAFETRYAAMPALTYDCQQGSEGSPMDKLRLVLVWLLTSEALPGDSHMERLQSSLASAGADTTAVAYLRRMRSMKLTGLPTTQFVVTTLQQIWLYQRHDVFYLHCQRITIHCIVMFVKFVFRYLTDCNKQCSACTCSLQTVQAWSGLVKELLVLPLNLLESLHGLAYHALATLCCMTTGGGVRGSASSVALDGLAGAGLGPQSNLLSWADRAFGPGLTTITKGRGQRHVVHQHSSSAQPFVCLWPKLVSATNQGF